MGRAAALPACASDTTAVRYGDIDANTLPYIDASQPAATFADRPSNVCRDSVATTFRDRDCQSYPRREPVVYTDIHTLCDRACEPYCNDDDYADRPRSTDDQPDPNVDAHRHP